MLFDASSTLFYIKLDNSFHLLEVVNYIKFSFSNQFAEDLSIGNDSWKKYFNYPAKQSLNLSIQGIFNNCKAGLEIFKYTVNPSFLECKISFATGDIIQGRFLVNNFDKITEISQEITYRISLSNCGEIQKLHRT